MLKKAAVIANLPIIATTVLPIPNAEEGKKYQNIYVPGTYCGLWQSQDLRQRYQIFGEGHKAIYTLEPTNLHSIETGTVYNLAKVFDSVLGSRARRSWTLSSVYFSEEDQCCWSKNYRYENDCVVIKSWTFPYLCAVFERVRVRSDIESPMSMDSYISMQSPL